MFIRGGGFKGNVKHKPEIVEMGKYFNPRGWVYVSIDYRTAEVQDLDGKSQQEIVEYYRGIAPWNGWKTRLLEPRARAN